MEVKEDLMGKGSENGIGESPDVVIAGGNKKRREKKRTNRGKLIRTAFDGLLILFLGMQASQKGPAFLDLQLISGTDVEGASSYFTSNSFGYMVGALAAGFLYDKLNNKMILICSPLTIAGFLIGLTPWCTSYISMLLIHMASAFGCAIPETTVTADQLNIWKGKSEGAIQFLSFTYSLGGVLGPLYTKPFLAPKWNETDTDPPQTGINPNNLTALPYIPSSNSSLNNTILYSPSSSSSVPANQTNDFSHRHPPESDLHYAYMISGIFGLLFSVPFYVLCMRNCTGASNEEKKREDVESQQKRLAFKPYLILIVITSVFYFFYTFAEDAFNMFLSMFVVSHLSWSKDNGALVSSLYWGIGTVSKLLSVPILRRVDLGHILLASCLGMVLSLLGLLLSGIYHVDILVWISSSVFAMSQSTIFGGCFSWVDTHILRLDGKATSALLIFAGFGSMAGPLVIGVTMEKYSIMVFPWIELIQSVIASCIFLAMYFFLKPFVIRTYGPVRRTNNANLLVSGSEMEVKDEKTKMMSDDFEDDFNRNGKQGGKIQS